MRVELTEFISRHMQKGGRYVAARLQAAITLLERLREVQELRLEAHKKPNSAGLNAHESFGKRAHDRLGLEPINKNHGRRSSDVGGWGQQLLDAVRDAGFEDFGATERNALIDETQACIGQLIRGILEQEPLEARLKGRSAETVIREVLKQAEAKGKSGDVAQYLVGAKLMLRFGLEIPVTASNKGDRKSRSDASARTGDFEIENATIEVAMGTPDEKHLAQIAEALDDSDNEFWLLTRHDRVATWQNEVNGYEGIDVRRIVIAGVEAFVGQNVSEMGQFSAKGKASQLSALFELYNNRWICHVGTPGMLIVTK